MYDNIGGKIKGLARIIGIGGLIAFLLAGIIVIASDEYAVVPMLICFAMAVVCLVSSWPLYGFGKLVQDMGDLKELKAKEVSSSKAEPPKSVEDELPNL